MKKHYIFLLLAGILFIFAGCGGGGGGGSDAPFEAVITISPESSTIEVDEASLVATYVAQFVIAVKDSTGVPLNDVNLTIFYPWAEPNASVVRFFDGDPNRGGVFKDSPMAVTTDENGAYTLYFEYDAGGGLEYKADIQVISGSVVASATFEVKKVTAEE
ncbi:MAG: hypothetical protein C4538_09530 [Nitrospiraceae bacterium]|nr:MAG: hypothetical protein C4538_09530 [Nitrospiraceae bacterium]